VANTNVPESNTVEVVDGAVASVRAARARWAQTKPLDRARLLDDCRARFFRVAPQMVALGQQMKGLADDVQPEVAEEWAFAIGTLKLFRVYAATLREVAAKGRPTVKGPWRTRPDGQVVVEVAPVELSERLSLGGGSAEVWLELGITLDEAKRRQGEHWQRPPAEPPVMGLLAAGNVPMLVVGDILHALFLRGAVVVCKLNPVNADLLPLWRETFAPLIDAGCLALVTGDAAAGVRLCTHDDVELIHMTGSHHTHDAVVFGRADANAGAAGARVVQNNRPITAELGNITPVIVVPGPWTAQELRYHAVQLGSQHGLNAAFNCLTPRLLVTSSSWPQRTALLDELRAFFAALPTRRAYYPGARARHARACAAHTAELLGAPVPDDALPWTLIAGLHLDGPEHDVAQEPSFREESFCSVLAEATVDADSVDQFLARATTLVNERVWGNLTATLLVHPETAKRHAAAVEAAVAGLRYGVVCVNTFGSMAYVTPTLPWGAAPNNAAADIQSGTGMVHNLVDLPSPQKAVMRAPFTVGSTAPLNLLWPKTTPLLREVTALEFRPSLRAGLGVARALLG